MNHDSPRTSDWRLLPYFIAAARSGSLRAAAEHLNATHATVRRQIEALEASYGVQLFRRSRDGLTLTAAGKTLLPTALEAEAVVQRGRNGVQGLDREASGTIRVSLDPMTGHFLLAPVFADFCRLYPEIDLDIRLSYELASLNRLETDVSIRHAPEPMEDVVARKLFSFGIGIYASRGYVDRALPKAGPRGRGLNWIGYGPEPALRKWIEASPFPEARIRHSVADPEMHLQLARAGAGMTFLAAWCEQRFPELQRIPGTALDDSRSTWILLHEDLRRVTRIRIFVDFVAASMLERRVEMMGA